MKRVALLIGNSNGLSGVKNDIGNWRNFLKSDYGGRWYDDEINIVMNPTKNDLSSKIDRIKADKPDFAIVVFSGHGAYKKSTLLEINAFGDLISENDLIGIAPRQISAFDCCRNVIRETIMKANESMRMFADAIDNTMAIRRIYDARIMNAIEQQVRLYACSVDESALDTGSGGLYTKNLLECAYSVPNSSSYKLVGVAHEEARERTVQIADIMYHSQHPDSILPRCLSSQQLIISINPYFCS